MSSEEKNPEVVEALVTNDADVKEEGSRVALDKSVGLRSSILLMIGSIIGTGVFMSPQSIVEAIPSMLLSLLVWLVCGIIALVVGLCYAELGLMYKSCGGEYVYLEKAYHPIAAFSFMISNFYFIKPISVSILVLFFVQNILVIPYGSIHSVPYWPARLLSVVVTILIAILNCASNKWSLRLNDILTYSKFICVGIIFGITIYKVSIGEFENFAGSTRLFPLTAGAVSTSLYNGMWSYDGFNQIAYIVEEMKNPKRNVVLTVFISMIIIVTLYVLLNLCYLIVLGVDGIISSSAVATDVAVPYMGRWSAIIGILVSLSALGSANATAFCGGRIYFDAARNHHLPRVVALLHKDTRTMMPSLVIQAIFTIIFLLTVPDGSTLLLYFSNAAWLYYGATTLAVVVLRFRNKEHRQFKIWIGLPCLATIISFALLILGFFDSWQGSLISLGMCAVSIPIYFLFVFHGGVLPEAFTNFIERFTLQVEFLFDLIMPKSADET